jgi:uncharacterized protein
MFKFLLVLILIVFLGRAFWQLVDGIVEGATGRRSSGAGRSRGIAMARDPVCGTFVVPERAVAMTVAGQQLYFCSDACRDRYRAPRRDDSDQVEGRTA